MDDIVQRDAVLAGLLPNVAFDGWSAAALLAAARRAGVDEAELARLFPRGPIDAIAWFSHWADRRAMETVAAQKLEGMRVGERIALAVRTRLDLLAPHREAVRRALALLALPLNAPLGLRLLYDTVDALWYAAGDTAADFSFYTKRGLLAGIYAATTLYWLDDRSPDGSATEAFLARRLAESASLPRLRARLERALDAVPNPFRLFRMPGRRL
ncbi:MAG TPA: COQ9 family protein [Stellaceae bacterium]|nr:COQ9 family protein [Stellaceae bacterium]